MPSSIGLAALGEEIPFWEGVLKNAGYTAITQLAHPTRPMQLDGPISGQVDVWLLVLPLQASPDLLRFALQRTTHLPIIVVTPYVTQTGQLLGQRDGRALIISHPSRARMGLADLVRIAIDWDGGTLALGQLEPEQELV